MSKEQLIIKTSANQLINGGIIGMLVGYFYRITGNKLTISFHGSKGYLDVIEFQCEGNQKAGQNIIDVSTVTLKRGRFSKKSIYILHSEEEGIRIAIGKLQFKDSKKNF